MVCLLKFQYWFSNPGACSMFCRVMGGFTLLLWATCSAGETSPGERAYARGDYFSAATAFRDAASKGDVRAQKRLGDMYADGVGVPQNYTEAIKWYCRSAEQGYQPALARLYGFGFAGRPGAYDTSNLKAACEPLLHPPPRVEAVPQTNKENGSEDIRVTIERYTTTDDNSGYRFRNHYPYPHVWRRIKPRPPVHRPGFRRPPFARPTPGSH